MYIGQTNQRSETWITQHVTAYLHSSRVLRSSQAVHDLSIGQHLLDNPDCATEYDDAFFSILNSVRSVLPSPSP